MTEQELRYPIGLFNWPSAPERTRIEGWIKEIEALPQELRRAVDGLSSEDRERVYRPGGWTIRQLVHHIGDSHMNCLIRFKWAMTEDKPVIKPYHEDRWAELEDYRTTPIPLALDFVETVHRRLSALLRSLSDSDLKKQFHHPEYKTDVALGPNIGQYAWHGRHHLAHIALAKSAGAA